MKVVTHNIVHTLNLGATSIAVQKALSRTPQIVGFQEFDQKDNAALEAVSHRVIMRSNEPLKTSKNYLWCQSSAGGLPVLLLKKYTKSISAIQQIMMARGNANVRPTPACEVRFVNRFGRKIAVLNTHPMAHLDRPAYLAAHREAIKNIEAWVVDAKKDGFVPILTMDGNGTLDVKGLINCWQGNKKLPTGPGGNTIDVVSTVERADGVSIFETPSDHNGVVAVYTNFEKKLRKR